MQTQEKTQLRISYIAHGDCWANPLNPREVFPEKELAELRDSIAEDGIHSPIAVRFLLDPYSGAHYQIIFGERRWRASDGTLAELPCIIFNVDDDAAREMALDENFQRSDLTVEEEATIVQGYLLIGLSPAQIAGKRKKSIGWVNNRVAYMKVGEDIREVGKRVRKAMSALVQADRVKDAHKKNSVRKSLLKRIEFNELPFRIVKAEVEQWVDNRAMELRAEDNARKQYQAPDAETERARNAFNRDAANTLIKSRQLAGPTPAPVAATPRPLAPPRASWTAPIEVKADGGADIFLIELPAPEIVVGPEPEPETPEQIESRAQRRQAINEANAEVLRAVAALEAFLPLCDDETHKIAEEQARRVIRGNLMRK